MTGKRLKGKQLSLITSPRKGGNTQPKQGRWGLGVETKTVRVPVEIAERLPDILQAVSRIVISYGQRSKKTRDWTIANRMLDELEPVVADLLLSIIRSKEGQPSDRE